MSYSNNNNLHIVAVNAAIRRDDGAYLVLKRSEDEKAYPGAWCFPGGKVEGNNTIDHALEREVLEETGLVMKPGKVLVMDTSFVRPDEQTVKVFVYLCQVEEGEIKIEEGSFTDSRWVQPAELPDMEHVGLEEDVAAAEKIISACSDLSAISVASKVKE